MVQSTRQNPADGEEEGARGAGGRGEAAATAAVPGGGEDGRRQGGVAGTTPGARPAFGTFPEARAWALGLTRKQLGEELGARGLGAPGRAEPGGDRGTLATVLADEIMREARLAGVRAEARHRPAGRRGSGGAGAGAGGGGDGKQSFPEMMERALELDRNELLQELKQIGAEIREDLSKTDLAKQLAQLQFWGEEDRDPDNIHNDDPYRPRSLETLLGKIGAQMWRVILVFYALGIKPVIEEFDDEDGIFSGIKKSASQASSKLLSAGARQLILTSVNSCIAGLNAIARWAGGDSVPARQVLFAAGAAGVLLRRGLGPPLLLLVGLRLWREAYEENDKYRRYREGDLQQKTKEKDSSTAASEREEWVRYFNDQWQGQPEEGTSQQRSRTKYSSAKYAASYDRATGGINWPRKIKFFLFFLLLAQLGLFRNVVLKGLLDYNLNE